MAAVTRCLALPGDLLVIMGAGPVWKVAKGFLDGK